jgi:hypothetical protein
MIASFFQRLEEHGARYLLISGQATILYGAATFSEDVDIWLEPEQRNIERFLAALRDASARYYKLTPALDVRNCLEGHGFHFVIPDPEDALDIYLDVMGQPPRVGSFAEAAARSRRFTTDFGVLPTVGIKDLVEIKKTQRSADYPIIGRLALAHLSDPNTSQDDAELRWALDHVFGLGELRAVVAARPQSFGALAASLPPALGAGVAALAANQELRPDSEDQLDAWLEARTAPLRAADRRYWRPIIEELRRLKRTGQLMPEGQAV